MAILKNIKELFLSKHIQLALVSGASMIALALISKRILPAPMKNIYIIIPALIVTAAEGVMGVKKRKWYTNINHWIIAVVVTTILIIVPHLIRQ